MDVPLSCAPLLKAATAAGVATTVAVLIIGSEDAADYPVAVTVIIIASSLATDDHENEDKDDQCQEQYVEEDLQEEDKTLAEGVALRSLSCHLSGACMPTERTVPLDALSRQVVKVCEII